MPASVRAFTVRLCSVQVARTKERLAEAAKKSKGKKGPGGALTGDALVAALAGEVAIDEQWRGRTRFFFFDREGCLERGLPLWFAFLVGRRGAGTAAGAAGQRPHLLPAARRARPLPGGRRLGPVTQPHAVTILPVQSPKKSDTRAYGQHCALVVQRCQLPPLFFRRWFDFRVFVL
jgi:hypothetical protein